MRNPVTEQAIQEILNECARIAEEPIPTVELERQREYLAGNFLLSLEDVGRTAERVQDIDLFNLVPDFYTKYVARVNAVDVAKAQELAKKHLPVGTNGYVIVVVGEAKEIVPTLEKLGPVKVYDQDLKPKQ